MKLGKNQLPKAPKPPERISQAFEQLRENSMLIPIILLVVAIIAVPVLLGRSSDDPAGQAAIAGSGAAGAANESSGLEPVVLASAPGLRDYRERLDPFSANNPFRQQLTKAPKSADTGGDGSASGDVTSGGGTVSEAPGTAPAGDPVPSEPVPTDPVPTDPGEGSGNGPVTDPNGGSGQGNGGGDGNGGGPVDTEPTKITVRYGPAGNTQLLIDLKPVHELAGPDDPLARFRRVSEGAAVFGVSPEVDVSGAFKCLSSADPCDLIRLKVGDEAKLTYRPTGETYRLQLVRVK